MVKSHILLGINRPNQSQCKTTFMTEQFILIKSDVREATLPKTMTKNGNHQDEIAYFREGNKTKAIIIQTLLENQKITQSAPDPFSKLQYVNLMEPITDKGFITPTHSSSKKYATQVIRYHCQTSTNHETVLPYQISSLEATKLDVNSTKNCNIWSFIHHL